MHVDHGTPLSAMSDIDPHDELNEDALRRFAELVDSVGVKRFSHDIGISTRQVNRILAGVQPNPVLRLIRTRCRSRPPQRPSRSRGRPRRSRA